MFKYKTHGTCSNMIYIDIDENDIIQDIRFEGGCRGNTQGVSKLCLGRNAHEVHDLITGIQCQCGTSCPDQLSKAIDAFYAAKN